MPDALDQLPRTPLTDARLADGAVVFAIGAREFRDLHPTLAELPSSVLHLGPWKVTPGGSLEESPEAETGLLGGFSAIDHDDSAWAACARINEVSIGAPSWESDSFRGWIWYRGEFVVPAGWSGTGRLTLGSPTECRRLGWSVFLDGAEVTGGIIRTPVLDLDLPADRLSAGTHRLAVRQQVDADLDADRRQELEGWRRIDVFCQQTLTIGPGFASIALDQATITGDGAITLRDRAGRWQLEARYASVSDGALKTSRLTRLAEPTVLSDVTCAEIEGAVGLVHPEGFWVGLDRGAVVAGADPAAVTVGTSSGAAVRCWPGRPLGPGDWIDLPPVFVGADSDDDPLGPISRLLTRLGRPRRDVSIYDPYGWYQISHASEPKIEVSDQLMGPIGEVLAKARGLGLSFDFLSLDCGWNDPDDLSRFHPTSFPNGPQSVLDTVAATDTALMLWVSPSDGPRAFRHELGLANPGFESGSAQNPGLPWRLCPSFAPWRDTFRAALLRLVEAYGVRGFKLDGTELYCRAADHDHLPGLWSIFANVRTLQATFDAVSAAGAPYLMLYWGLRSPWWLRCASTVWERGYLVEAAAPSGRASWTIRGSVMSSQDIGTTADWWSLPPHLQDSLGVWVSDTRWASHQGLAGWDDATVMDAARGSRALQLWGDLRPLVGEESDRLRQVYDLLRSRADELDGIGTPLGAAASGTAAYGYAWRGSRSVWVVLSQPGDGSRTYVRWSDLGVDPDEVASARIDYLSRGAAAEVRLDPEGMWVSQTGGSVIAVLAGREVRSTDRADVGTDGTARIGDPTPVGTMSITDLGTTHEPPPQSLLAPAYIGRVPHLANWMAGNVGAVEFDPAMLIGTPAEDRELSLRSQSWRVDLEVGRDAELAVVVRFTRKGAAWHHDLLHEIARISVLLDSEPAAGTSYPTFRHEQAGSWSWLRWTGRVGGGSHRLAVTLDAVCPPDLDTTADVWLR